MGHWNPFFVAPAGTGIYYVINVGGDIYAAITDGRLYKSTALGPFVQVAARLLTYTPNILFYYNGNVMGWDDGSQKLLLFNGAAWTLVGSDTGAGDNVGGMNNLPGGPLHVVTGAHYKTWNGVATLAMTTDLGPGASDLKNMIAASDGFLYFGSQSGRLYKATDGAAAMAANVLAGRGYCTVVEYMSSIYGIMRNLALYKWDGVSSWTQILGDLITGQYAYNAMVADGMIYFGTGNTGANGGRLYAYRLADGALRLLATQVSPYESVFNLLLRGGRIFASSANGALTSGAILEYIDPLRGNKLMMPTFVPGL